MQCYFLMNGHFGFWPFRSPDHGDLLGSDPCHPCLSVVCFAFPITRDVGDQQYSCGTAALDGVSSDPRHPRLSAVSFGFPITRFPDDQITRSQAARRKTAAPQTVIVSDRRLPGTERSKSAKPAVPPSPSYTHPRLARVSAGVSQG